MAEKRKTFWIIVDYERVAISKMLGFLQKEGCAIWLRHVHTYMLKPVQLVFIYYVLQRKASMCWYEILPTHDLDKQLNTGLLIKD